MNATYTYTVTVKPIIGDAMLLIKLSNEPAYPNPNDVTTFHYKADSPGLAIETKTMTYSDRLNYNFDCDKATYANYNGKEYCAFYIGVVCSSNCIFNITVDLVDRIGAPVVTPPKYLIENSMYYGRVKYGEIQYFYLPLHRNNTGDMAIHLNKTGILGQVDDTLLLTNI